MIWNRIPHIRMDLNKLSSNYLNLCIQEIKDQIENPEKKLKFSDSSEDYDFVSIKNGWGVCQLFRASDEILNVSSSQLPNAEKLLVHTFNFVHSLCDHAVQFSILKLVANAKLEWHTHANSQYHILQIPIITNPNTFYKVIKDLDRKKKNRIFKEKYEVGEVWRFNGEFYHSVVNNGNTDRYTLQIYISYTDRKFNHFLSTTDTSLKNLI